MVIVLQLTVNLHNMYDTITEPRFTMTQCVLNVRAEIAFKSIQYLPHRHKNSPIKVLLPHTSNENSVTYVSSTGRQN